MQASAANGFLNTSIADCSGTPHNFQPEYNTAKAGNIIPWAALRRPTSAPSSRPALRGLHLAQRPVQPNPIDPYDTRPAYNQCQGPYENAGPPDAKTPEAGDALCYHAGDTHPGYDGVGTSTPPDRMTGCQDNMFQNGDLDFDGTPYWTEWPTGLTPRAFPSRSWNGSRPRTAGSTRSTSSRPTWR